MPAAQFRPKFLVERIGDLEATSLAKFAGKLKKLLLDKGGVTVNTAGADNIYKTMKVLTLISKFLREDGGNGAMACSPRWETVEKPGPNRTKIDYARMAFDCTRAA